MVEATQDAPPPGAFPPDAIAIVGMAGRFPGAADIDAFWRLVLSGREALESFSDTDLDAAGVPAADRADPRYVRRGTALEDALLFDASFFGIPPREAEILDPQHRIFLECAWEAMEHAGYGPGTPAGVVGVYASASMNTYLLEHIIRNPAVMASVGGYQIMLGNDKDFLPTRVSYKLDLRGPSMAIQTACSSSLVAIEVACRELQRGACDMALAGGVSVGFPQRAGYLFQEGMILSPDGHCRPFDCDAAGTRPGAGAGIVVLKRLPTAIADGDTIHAVIRGIAVNNDGAGKIGYTAPSIDGQVEVIAMAQALAGVAPGSIAYVETHGTATKLGDPIEIAALTRVFSQAGAAPGFCRLGALKANIGHLDAAAGVAGLIKIVLMLRERSFPPLVNFVAPNPALGLEGGPFSARPFSARPFSARADAVPWTSHRPRRAGVSSFGIGGTNAHAVLEEAPPIATSPLSDQPQWLCVSAKTATALARASDRLAMHLDTHPEQALADIAWTSQMGRQSFAHRRCVVAGSHAAAAAALRAGGGMAAVHEGGVRPVAFLFSGQGSQHAGMGAALYTAEPAFRGVIDQCAALFAAEIGCDIRTVMFGENDAALAPTEWAQPALFSLQMALAELWRQRGIVPQAMLGHSVGEYAACVQAGVMSLADAIRVVAARGRLMAAMPAGGMAAAGAPASALAPYMAAGVEIAAFNAQALCTIAGPPEALRATIAALEQAGIATSRLTASAAFHSAMMAEALAPFAAVLAEVTLSPPRIPYVSGVTGTWITAEQATSPAYYAAHLRQPVRFADGMRTLATDPTLLYLEVGPGQSLAALARANLSPSQAGLVVASLPQPRAAHRAVAAMLEATGRLWLAGAPVDPRGMARGRRVPLPTYPFERQFFGVAASPPVAEDGGTRCYAPSWVRDDAPSSALHGVWLLLAEPGDLVDFVSAALAAAGASVVAAPQGAAFVPLLQKRPLSGVILLSGLQSVSGRELYARIVACGAALQTLLQPGDGHRPLSVIVATTGTQSVLEERVSDLSASLPLGAALALPAELAGLAMRVVDLPPGAPEHLAGLLVREAAGGFADVDVAWRGGRRWVRRFEPIQLAPGDTPLRRNGVVLITGGLGGIGLALAVRLARDHAARLLLTGRRALPPRDQWDAAGLPAWVRAAVHAIRAVEAAGGEVITAQADAADASAMAAAVGAASKRWGPLDGVIHAAGIAGSGKLTLLQNAADLAATLAPKAGGLAVLRDLFGGAKLDFVVLMSSINSVVPAAGTGDYAAANLVLDRFAEAGVHPPGWRNVVAIDWSAWAEIGMAADLAVPQALRAARREMLRNAIPTEAGVALFGRIVSSGRNRVVVTSYDLHRALTRPAPTKPSLSAPPESRSARAVHDRSTPFAPPASATEMNLASIWADLIGVGGIGVDDDFFDLGGHSLLATRVLSRIGLTLDVRLTLRELFEAPTIRRLAAKIDDLRALPGLVDADDQSDREEFVL